MNNKVIKVDNKIAKISIKNIKFLFTIFADYASYLSLILKKEIQSS